MTRPCHCLPALLLSLFTIPALVAAPPAEWRPAKALVIEVTSSSGRVPITGDGLLRAWAGGALDLVDAPPRVGDVLVESDGTERTWERVEATDGRVNVARGRWALVTFTADEAYDAVLDPGPSSMIFVNGAPRAGDPYALGPLEHPFRVRAGTNTLLYKPGRGPVGPVVRPAPAPITIAARDRTLPHARAGEALDSWAGLVVVNTSAAPLVGAVARTTGPGETRAESTIARIEPYSTVKVAFPLRGPAPGEAEPYTFTFAVTDAGGAVLTETTADLAVRARDDWFVRTYRSAVDGSVQYYAMREAIGADDGQPRGLAVSLHGAGVEATGQIPNYAPRAWAHIVATTNRRRFGFDHEDWGRLDMLEVIGDVEARYVVDPNRVTLTGHSMGGHGTWWNGLVDPDRWAAIGPSSGWATFWTYAGNPRIADDGHTGTILRRAANVSDTLLLLENAARLGVYVLHAGNDQTVPVREARAMRTRLAEFHTDWAYYERPGAGHWWGAPCLDWPPMMAFLEDHVREARPRTFGATVIDPHLPGLITRGVAVLAQTTIREPSAVRITPLKRDGGLALEGTTTNVARLALDLDTLVPDDTESGSVTIDLDGATFSAPGSGRLVLDRTPDRWIDARSRAPAPRMKSARLPSGFKSVFSHRPFLVYATGGDDEERRWARDKARFDAETFRYRGNGRLEVMSDADYLALGALDRVGRNVVLYGGADTNRAWSTLIPRDAPFDVGRGHLRVGTRVLTGVDHGLVLCYPAPDGERMVGVVAGTGRAGRRVTTTMRFFLSGAHFPDWTVCTPDVLERGWEAVAACGFFDHAWQYDPIQSAWASDLR